MDSLRLRIIAPDGCLLDEETDSVQMLASDGSFGVRPGHAPMLAALIEGPVLYAGGTQQKSIVIHGGIAEIEGDSVTILTL